MKELTLEQINNLTLNQLKEIKVEDIKSTSAGSTTDVKKIKIISF